MAQAEARYKQALQMVPDDAQVQNNLANALLAQGKRPQALSVAQRAARQAPHMPEVLDTLAAAVRGLTLARIKRTGGD